MKMEDVQTLLPPGAPQASPEVVQQLGAITRQLHDTLRQLGVMPKLQVAADGIPDARSRLAYVADKTAAAAEKVLGTVDAAKAEQALIGEQARQWMARLEAEPAAASAHPEAFKRFLQEVQSRTQTVDGHLTEIMMAQDFHDLTGQVVQKVVSLANDLEDSLVKLLIQVVPPEAREKVDATILNGPAIDAEHRTDVVHDQGEVDDLLASLGF